MIGKGGAAAKAAIERGRVVSEATIWARDAVNTPAAQKSPAEFAKSAQTLLRGKGVKVEILEGAALKRARLGGVIGVGQGSDNPPRLVKMTYAPVGARGTVALVGKGVVFDSGGLSLKTGSGMETMKTDMGGAAAVIGAMSALKDLGVKTKVVAFTPMVENMPSGAAIRPGDVLKIRNGKTVEVLNTDAEGRLILADGLSLAVEEKPDAIIDLATLTGACVVALGEKIAGLMTSNDGWGEQVRAAADRAGEQVWPLPLPEQYNKLHRVGGRGPQEHRQRRLRRRADRRALPAGVRGRRAVGAPRHRRPGPGVGRRRCLRAGRYRLRCAHPRRARQQLQEAGDQRKGPLSRVAMRLLVAFTIAAGAAIAFTLFDPASPGSATARPHVEAPPGEAEVGDPAVEYSEDSSGARVTVAMKDNDYVPQTLTVDYGTIVVWENEGRSNHNVIPDKKATGWRSKTIKPGRSFAQQLDQPGAIGYFCTFHGAPGKGMYGTLIVKNANGTVPTDQARSFGTARRDGQAAHDPGARRREADPDRGGQGAARLVDPGVAGRLPRGRDRHHRPARDPRPGPQHGHPRRWLQARQRRQGARCGRRRGREHDRAQLHRERLLLDRRDRVSRLVPDCDAHR